MQSAVLATEVEQGIAAGIERRTDDFADKDDVVAAIVELMPAAFEIGQSVGQQRRVMLAPLPRRLTETVLTGLGEEL
jgi:hypothetical protein